MAGKTGAIEILYALVSDPTARVEISLAGIQLAEEAEQLDGAIKAYELLLKNSSLSEENVRDVKYRYFESLVAFGKADDAIGIVSATIHGLPRDMRAADHHQAEEIRRWIPLLITTGSSLAERQYFLSASRLLELCVELMDFQEDSAQDGYNVSEILRLCASCQLLAISEAGNAGSVSALNKHLLDSALANAERSDKIESNNFVTRMILFRTHLLKGDAGAAGRDIEGALLCEGFSIDALVAAAVEAKEAGLENVTISVFRGVLSAPSIKSDVLPSNFYG